ncbi:MAG: pilus assembly protein TadD [Rhodobiaceae bacterium]|nr:MAG: pilus assembly protein TadD [Rhodobiaceae bacterium]
MLNHLSIYRQPPQVSSKRRWSDLNRTVIATALGALMLSGCAADGPPERPGLGASSDLPIHSSEPRDFVASAAYWGGIYEQDPENAEAAAKYARGLRHLGSLQQALMVLQRAVQHHPNDAALLSEYGKALTTSGKPDQASALLAKAASLDPSDWTILSAAGVAFDEMGEHAKAKEKYAAALHLAPNHPTVLTNLGLSYALSGDLVTAETVLRRAISNPAAGVHARQNLALVLGLKGDFEEAERLARADLPPSLATSNISYLRSLLAQPALWQQMEALDAPIAEPTMMP